MRLVHWAVVHESEVNRNDLQVTDQLDPSHTTDTVLYDLEMKAKLPITPISILHPSSLAAVIGAFLRRWVSCKQQRIGRLTD